MKKLLWIIPVIVILVVAVVFVAAYDDGPEFYDPGVYPEKPKGGLLLGHPTAPMDTGILSYSFETLEDFYEYDSRLMSRDRYEDEIGKDPRNLARKPFPAKEIVDILLSSIPEFSIKEISGQHCMDFANIVYYSIQFSWKDEETGDVIATFDLRCNQEKPIDVYYDATCQFRMDHETFTVYRDNEDPLCYKVPLDSTYSCIFKISEQYKNPNPLFWSFLECCSKLQTMVPAIDREQQWKNCHECGVTIYHEATYCSACLAPCNKAEEGSEY